MRQHCLHQTFKNRLVDGDSSELMPDLLSTSPNGLYCSVGDFYIDPWQPVKRAVLTHAHADHARPGSDCYLAAREGAAVLRTRLGENARIQSHDWNETVEIDGVKLSFHPSGHILGAAQIRLEHGGDVWCVSGDYKLETDPTCHAFEPVVCRVFVTESTFGLPIYRWPKPTQVFDEINRWWSANAAEGRVTVLFAYSLGKAQRLLASLDPSIGPMFCHGAVHRLNQAYADAGCELPACRLATEIEDKAAFRGSLIVAPPSAQGTPWMRRFGDCATGFVSGWMLIRGQRRRRKIERGFVLSDHADWDGLNTAIRQSGAERVLVTHGQAEPMARWLNEQGLEASELPTEYAGEVEE